MEKFHIYRRVYTHTHTHNAESAYNRATVILLDKRLKNRSLLIGLS